MTAGLDVQRKRCGHPRCTWEHYIVSPDWFDIAVRAYIDHCKQAHDGDRPPWLGDDDADWLSAVLGGLA